MVASKVKSVKASKGVQTVIWKESLALVTGEQEITVPAGSKLLTVQSQNGMPTLWHSHVYKMNPGKSVTKKIYALYTGTPTSLPKTAKYLGTHQSGGMVYHYFG